MQEGEEGCIEKYEILRSFATSVSKLLFTRYSLEESTERDSSRISNRENASVFPSRERFIKLFICHRGRKIKLNKIFSNPR